MKKLIIVGGVAGGATAAARARRLSEDAEIVMFERGRYVSFANCGLPYYVGGEIAQRGSLLVQTKAGLSGRFNLDIRVHHEVLAIDREAKRVRVRDLKKDVEFEESYDTLLLSPGAEPIRPPLKGIDDPRVHTLRNLDDVDRIKEAVDGGVEDALVVGGGFIGLELAENLTRRGIRVTLVELLPQVLPPVDAEMAAPVHAALKARGVRLVLADGVTGFEEHEGRLRATLRSGGAIDCDLVAMAVGVRPESRLAREAGLEVNERGGIVVDAQMRTSDPSIYAVGDAVQVRDPVLGGEVMIPLAGPANRQARIAVDAIFGREAKYRGTQGTSIVRVFDLTVAATGVSEKLLRQKEVAYKKVYVSAKQHVAYFPGADWMTIKLLYGLERGEVLGAQIVGTEGVDKRIDVLAMAIQAGLTVHDLEEVELAYAPQYGAAKDPINLVGFVACNALCGDVEFLYADEAGPAPAEAWTVVDVRDDEEYLADHIPGSIQIPLMELRDRLEEIPRDKPIAVCCYTGQRSYYATRILRQRGVACKNMAGGMRVYRCFHPAESGAADAAPPCCGKAACG